MEEQKDIVREESGKRSLINFENKDFFDVFETSNRHFKFAYKKTERLSAAVYLVTEHIPDREDIKDKMRGRCLALLSGVAHMEREEKANAVLRDIAELISMLEIAHAARFISQMNTAVLVREYGDLGMFLGKYARQVSFNGVALSRDLFAERIEEERPAERTYARGRLSTFPPPKAEKQNATADKGQKDIKKTSKPQTSSNDRKDIILSLLKQKDKITVKDISSVIADCSEKTIQRELISLLEEGVLKKEGARRWSAYTLV